MKTSPEHQAYLSLGLLAVLTLALIAAVILSDALIAPWAVLTAALASMFLTVGSVSALIHLSSVTGN